MAFVSVLIGLLALLWNLSQERTHTLLVDLPYFYHSHDEAPPAFDYLTVEVTASGETLFNGEKIPIASLADAVRNAGLDVPTVLFSPHPDAPYGAAALALNAISEAGVPQSEICFDRLSRFRIFDKVAFRPDATYVVMDKGKMEITSVSDIAPSGCAQFYEAWPEVI